MNAKLSWRIRDNAAGEAYRTPGLRGFRVWAGVHAHLGFLGSPLHGAAVGREAPPLRHAKPGPSPG